MKILIVVSNFPHPGHPYSGSFNKQSVVALNEFCEKIEVLAPRPYVPPFFSFFPRWEAYKQIERYSMLNDIAIYRPAYLQVPRFFPDVWLDRGAFLCCRNQVRVMHKQIGFDAILSFDLVAAGGLAWRLGKDLGIPAAGWATGDDMRHPSGSPLQKVVVRALQQLNKVFYQSRELLEISASLLSQPSDLIFKDKHVVLARGVPDPPNISIQKTRDLVRSALGIKKDHIVVMNIGRIVREKGIGEILEAASQTTSQHPNIVYVLVGSHPAFDQTTEIQNKINEIPYLKNKIIILPACGPGKVWELLSAADIFLFPSYQEGMPNSLLEAMAMGVPSIAFGIPPILEIDGGKQNLLVTPPFQIRELAEAILKLAHSPEERKIIGERGREAVRARFSIKKNMLEAVRVLGLVHRYWPQTSKRKIKILPGL